MAGGFDFAAVAIILAGISFGMVGLILAGSALFPEVAEQYKRRIPNILIGLILVGVSSALVAAF